MKESTAFFVLNIGFLFFLLIGISFPYVFGCSEKTVTQFEQPKVEEKSVKESLAEDLLAEFQDNLSSWNACVIYNGVEYTNLNDFLNRNK